MSNTTGNPPRITCSTSSRSDQKAPQSASDCVREILGNRRLPLCRRRRDQVVEGIPHDLEGRERASQGGRAARAEVEGKGQVVPLDGFLQRLQHDTSLHGCRAP
jgi:hypothetical protein